jgi:uncharacterized protein (TIGR00369 family)
MSPQHPPAIESGFAELIGYRLAAWREGYAEIVLELEPKHFNRLGAPHGGLLAALIDTACGYAGVHPGPDGEPRRALTLSLTVQYLAQAKPGATLVTIGRVVGGGRRICFATAEVRDDTGALIARGDGTFRFQSAGKKNNIVSNVP